MSFTFSNPPFSEPTRVHVLTFDGQPFDNDTRAATTGTSHAKALQHPGPGSTPTSAPTFGSTPASGPASGTSSPGDTLHPGAARQAHLSTDARQEVRRSSGDLCQEAV